MTASKKVRCCIQRRCCQGHTFWLTTTCMYGSACEVCFWGGWATLLETPITPVAWAHPSRTCNYHHVHTHAQTHHLIADLLAGERCSSKGKIGDRISNGPGMKRFLIFRLAAFQWTAVLNGVQALIPAPGSIICVSCRSPWSPQCAATGEGKNWNIWLHVCTGDWEDD